jgi:hypothetical protein
LDFGKPLACAVSAFPIFPYFWSLPGERRGVASYHIPSAIQSFRILNL